MEKKALVHKIGEFYYFTTDEEIKEPCWALIFPETGDLTPKLRYISNIPQNPKYFDIGNNAIFRHICKKIVATTNSELWYKERYNVKNAFSGIGIIPELFILTYISAYNADKPITEVMLEYDEMYSEVSDYERKMGFPILRLNTDGSVIWSLKEEKMYTREEMNKALSDWTIKWSGRDISFTEELKEWFDKHYPQ